MFDVCARFKNNCELSMIRSIKVQEVNSLLINFNDLNDRTFWKPRCHKNCISSIENSYGSSSSIVKVSFINGLHLCND